MKKPGFQTSTLNQTGLACPVLLIHLGIVVLAGTVGIPGLTAAPKITITDIETPPEVNSLTPKALNNLDQVVGTYGTTDNQVGAFLFLPEPAYDLPAGFQVVAAPQGTYFQPTSLNDNGLIGGGATNTDNGQPLGATLANAGGIISHTLFANNKEDASIILDVNNAGHYVGQYRFVEEDGYHTRGFIAVVQRATRTDIPSPINNFRHTYPVAMNESGNIAGNFTNQWGGSKRGFFWDGQAQILDGGTVEDDRYTEAYDMNDSGQVVGLTNRSVDGITQPTEVFLWLPGGDYGLPSGFNILPIPGDFSQGRPIINNNGQVITYKYLWDRGELHLLKDLMSEGESREIDQLSILNDFNNTGTLLVDIWNNESYRYDHALLKIELPPVRIEIDIPKPNYKVDDQFTATVSVISSAQETLTVSFEDTILEELPWTGQSEDAILALTGNDLPDPFELTPEDHTRSFEVLIVAEKVGLTDLESTIIYSGTEVPEETLRTTAPVNVSPLAITLRAKPLIDEKPIVNMKLVEVEEEKHLTDSEGNPVVPKVEVIVENLTDRPINAFLQGVDPRARDQSVVLGRIETIDNFPIDLGTLEKGTPVSHEVDLKINQDGRFEFTTVVTGTIAGTTRQFNSVGRGAPIAVNDLYPVEIELEFVRTPAITNQNNGAFFMQPGSGLKVLASVKNLTTASTLHFYGIKAEKKLNVQGAVLTSEDGNLVDPPFAHDHEVEANGSVVLSGIIKTDPDGAPAGTVRWIIPDKAYLVEDLSEERFDLTQDDFLVKTNMGGWLGDELSTRIIQDYSMDPIQQLTGLESAAYFSNGVLLGIGGWTYDTFDGIASIGTLLGHISLVDPTVLANSFGESARAVWESAELAAFTWSNMTQEERNAFIASATDEVWRRGTLLANAPFDVENYTAAYNFTLDATYGLFGGVESAYATDDPAQIADMWGRVSGKVGMEVVSAALPTPKFTQFTKGAEAVRLATNKNIARTVNAQEAFLRAVRSGAVDEATSIKHWGVGGKNLFNIKNVFKRFGVKGYLRERSPKAFRLIDELREAVWKPELMKPKGISDIDLLLIGEPAPKLLGKEPGLRQIDLEGVTAIFMPEPDDVIRTRLASKGHSDDVIDAAISRAKMRRKEFEDYVPEFEAWSAGDGIPVAKNYVDNGIPNPVDEKDVVRNFEFQRYSRGDKPTIYVPKMADEAGRMRYISGDVDWVHFSFLDGSPLDADTARKLYDAMTRCCGLQHPETISWIKEGQTLFKGKANQLVDYLRGPNKKALLEVGGESTRAVRMSENLTRFAKNGRDHLVFFDGGIKSRLRSSLSDIENAFAFFQSKFPDRRVLTPFLWISKGDQILEDTSIDGKDWSFTTSNDDATLARLGDDGRVERFDGTSWFPWDLASEAGPLALSPATTLAADVENGDTVVPIVDLPQIWSGQLAGHLENWFEAGQTIIIDPGGSTQEIRNVVALSSLVLDPPLQYNHKEGTLVSVIPANMEVTPNPNDQPLRNLLISRNQTEETTTIIWISEGDKQYVLEESLDLSPESWTLINTPQEISSDITSVTFPVPNDDIPAHFYRLREVSE